MSAIPQNFEHDDCQLAIQLCGPCYCTLSEAFSGTVYGSTVSVVSRTNDGEDEKAASEDR
jgi:hypothetical protein